MAIEYVFVDASAFIALAAKKDRYHDRATRTYAELRKDRVNLLTSNHVFDETCTWILRDPTLGHRAAARFGNLIRSAATPRTFDERKLDLPTVADIVIACTSPEVENDAWDLFVRYDSSGFSFTDCASFAVMRALGIKRAFAYDSHFDILGFERL